MIFSFVVLICALSISGTGAYFSILGLATMFPGSAVSVITMGSVLEVGKIIAAVWLHLNWKRTNFLMKSYLTTAVIVLMLITSMGIFGFLSKAHIEHSYLTDKEVVAAEQIDGKIARERELIARQESYISQASRNIESSSDTSKDDIALEEKRMDSINVRLKEDISLEQKIIEGYNNRRKELDQAVAELESQQGGLFSSKKTKLEQLKTDQAAERTDLSNKIAGAEKRIQDHRDKADKDIEKSLQKIDELQKSRGSGKVDVTQDIEKYNAEINLSLERISALEAEKAKFQAAAQELEAEVGPVKYVAKLFEDFAAKQIELDSAVRLIIIVLIFVFDPLAVLLVLAATSGLQHHLEKIKNNKSKVGNEKAILKLTQAQRKELDAIDAKLKKLSNITDMAELPEDIKQKIESLEASNQQLTNRLDKMSQSINPKWGANMQNILNDNQNLLSEIKNLKSALAQLNELVAEQADHSGKSIEKTEYEYDTKIQILEEKFDTLSSSVKELPKFQQAVDKVLEKATEIDKSFRLSNRRNQHMEQQVKANTEALTKRVSTAEENLQKQFKLSNDDFKFLINACSELIDKENTILAVQDEIVKGELSNGIDKIEKKLVKDNRDSASKAKQKERLREIVGKLKSKIEDF